MMNPFLQMMQRADEDLKDDLARRGNIAGRNPDEVLRSALEKHAKYKSFVSLGNSKPIAASSTVCGMARLQFGDGEYTQSVQELQRLVRASEYRHEPLPDIEEPVPLTRTLLRTPALALATAPRRASVVMPPGASITTTTTSGTNSGSLPNSGSSGVSSGSGGGVSATNSTASLASAHSASSSSVANSSPSRGSVTFRDAGPSLAFILSTTESGSGSGGGAAADSETGGPLSLRESGFSTQRLVSRRSTGTFINISAQPASSSNGTSSGGADTDAGGGMPSPPAAEAPLQRRPSMAQIDLAAAMAHQQQLLRGRRDSSGLELKSSSGARPQPTSPLPQSPGGGGGLGSPSVSQSGYAPSPPAGSDYLRSGASSATTITTSGAGAAPRELSPHRLVTYQSAPQPSGSRVQFATGGHQPDPLLRRKRSSILTVYGPYAQQRRPSDGWERRQSETDGAGGSGSGGGDVSGGGGGGVGAGGTGGARRMSARLRSKRQSSEADESAMRGSPNATTDGGASGRSSPIRDPVAPRLMSAADMAVISEAAKRYSVSQTGELRRNSSGIDAAAVAAGTAAAAAAATPAAAPPTSTPTLTSSVSFGRTSLLDTRVAAGVVLASAMGGGAAAAAASAPVTERTDGLLRVLRAPEAREPRVSFTNGGSGGNGLLLSARRSSFKHSSLPEAAGSADASGNGGASGGEGQLQPRPPPSASGGVGGGGFRRSYSLRSKSSGQMNGDVATAASAPAAGPVAGGASTRSLLAPPALSMPAEEEASARRSSPQHILPPLSPGSRPGSSSSSIKAAPASASATTAAAPGANPADGSAGSSLTLPPAHPQPPASPGAVSPVAKSGSGSGTPLQGWSSRKRIARLRRFTTDAVFARQSDSTAGGRGDDEEEDFSSDGDGSSDEGNGRGKRPVGAAAAAATVDGTGIGDGGDVPMDAVAQEVAGLQALLRKGGFRADIRGLLTGSAKFILMRRYKQAEALAAQSKVREKGWKGYGRK